MSPITKLFIVLHVVLSLLLTAGVVVFVNRVDDYQKIVADAQSKQSAANAAASAAAVSEGAARESLAKANNDLAGQIEQSRKDRVDAAAALADVNVKLADASKQIAIVQADNSKLTTTVQASQTAQSQYAMQLTDLRTTVDKLTKEKLELDTTVADLTQKSDVLEKQRRDLAEKVSLDDSQLQRATAALADAHIDINSKLTLPGTGVGAPPINGVVREVRLIDQVPYATISVGSSDAVIKGMQFKVIDRDRGDFLGMLTVESVDSNEATGRLYGPMIDRVKKGVEVRTQL